MSEEPVPVEAVSVPEESTGSVNTQVAKEVIAGYWGRGNTRKKRLEDAGHDPAQIEEEVTRIFNQK